MELRNYVKVYDNVIPPQTMGNMIRWFNTCEFTSGVVGQGVLNKNIRNVQTKPLTNLGKSLTEAHWCNLLNKFFEMHDPTTLNRQGPDIGTQYRSEIFFINDKQKKIAEETKLKFDKKYDGKIKTNISKEINYCKAEDYHQKYIQKRN